MKHCFTKKHYKLEITFLYLYYCQYGMYIEEQAYVTIQKKGRPTLPLQKWPMLLRFS